MIPPDSPAENEARMENASVEVWRWGPAVWLAIRSEDSVGKSIELSLDDAADVARALVRAANSHLRKVRDEPQA